MKLPKVTVLMLIVILGVAAAAFPQEAGPQKLKVVKCANLIDVRNGIVIHNAVIFIEGDKIKAVGTDSPVPPGMEVIDLGNATVLPGLIDCHTHLLENYNGIFGGDDPNMILTITQMSTAKRALLGAAMAREDLDAGITTVRDLGNSGWNGDVALRDAINAGWVTGPRIAASTRALSAAGGQFGVVTAEAQKIIEQEYVVISGVEEARRAVRQALYDGADLIKVIVNTGPRVVSLEEMKVIVEEAHRVGKKVAAHASDDFSARIAAEAGVDSIEHAYTISDAVLKMMAEKKIYLVPTDSTVEGYIEIMLKPQNPTPEQLEKQEERMRFGFSFIRQRLERAIRAGVPIAAGSDMYYLWPGKTRGQASLAMFRAYAESGMKPLEIIRAATINAADLLGWRNRVGSIEPQRYADLIAVEGDPLKDISELERIRFVMKGGAVLKHDFAKK